MSEAPRDQNFVTAALGQSSTSSTTTLPFLISSVTGRLLTDSAAGSGDVVGPASSTDNAVARFDGITGKLLQNSVVLIGDTGAITGALSLNLSGLTISQILATDASKNLVSLDVATYPSLTELSYVKGVTSAIQTQLNAKGTGTVTAVSIATANGFSGSSSGGATPALTIVAGAIVPTSVNGLVITTTTGTFTLTAAKTFSVLKTLTLDGTDGTTMTFPTTSKTIAANDGSNWTFGSQAIGDIVYASSTTAFTRLAAVAVGQVLVSAGTGTAPAWSASPQLTTIELGATSDTTLARVSAGVVSIEGVNIMTVGAAQTITGQNKFNNIIDVNNAIAASSNAATVPVTFRLNTVTNNSAATLTITMTTASAVDGQMTIVRIYDFSGVAQTITWVNTENSTVTAPTTSNGSTTLPLTVGFMYNSATSKWRCIASA